MLIDEKHSVFRSGYAEKDLVCWDDCPEGLRGQALLPLSQSGHISRECPEGAKTGSPLTLRPRVRLLLPQDVRPLQAPAATGRLSEPAGPGRGLGRQGGLLHGKSM